RHAPSPGVLAYRSLHRPRAAGRLPDGGRVDARGPPAPALPRRYPAPAAWLLPPVDNSHGGARRRGGERDHRRGNPAHGHPDRLDPVLRLTPPAAVALPRPPLPGRSPLLPSTTRN